MLARLGSCGSFDTVRPVSGAAAAGSRRPPLGDESLVDLLITGDHSLGAEAAAGIRGDMGPVQGAEPRHCMNRLIDVVDQEA